jgi:hypothetical protein
LSSLAARIAAQEHHLDRLWPQTTLLLLLLLQSLGSALPAEVQEVLGAPGVRAAFAIWTTTPWTIPANLAVAVNADLDYCLVKAEVGGQERGVQQCSADCMIHSTAWEGGCTLQL